ncbi:MAG: hypothetical protein KGR26_09775 [Cyanobacteria bacterium REEB65]|nr:hypothetical protein [Cyanobacteria bacterium REEB65]
MSSRTLQAGFCLALVVLAVPNGAIAAGANVGREPAGPPRTSLVASTDFNAPAKQVLALFGNVSNYPLIFRPVRQARVEAVDSAGRPARFFVEIDLGWPVGVRWMRGWTRWEGDCVEFHRLTGSIQAFDGTLAVAARGDSQSHVEYRAIVDPGSPNLPTWLGSLAEQAIMPGVIADAQRFVDRHVILGGGPDNDLSFSR